ncbi:ferredoxin [Pimelobacter simplex]|uniref:ferredoxin n=1 Tax=Nocardioides simplex TaxID=2045 RepID=UPI003AAF8642
MIRPRPDVRLATAPMQPVACGTCGAEVLARKSSWDQTTVQWDAAALAACAERRTPNGAAAPSDRPNRNAFPGCDALRASLRAAAVAGTLDVQSGEPLKTNPEQEHP